MVKVTNRQTDTCIEHGRPGMNGHAVGNQKGHPPGKQRKTEMHTYLCSLISISSSAALEAMLRCSWRIRWNVATTCVIQTHARAGQDTVNSSLDWKEEHTTEKIRYIYTIKFHWENLKKSLKNLNNNDNSSNHNDLNLILNYSGHTAVITTILGFNTWIYWIVYNRQFGVNYYTELFFGNSS